MCFVPWSFTIDTSTDNKGEQMNITIKLDLNKKAIDNDTKAKIEQIAKNSALFYAYKNGLLEEGSFQETHCKLKFG